MDAEFFDLVMENGRNIVFVKDEKSVIRFANRAFLDLYHPARRSDIVGTTTIKDYPAEQAELFLAEDRRAFEEGRTEIVEEITDYAGITRSFLTRKTTFTDRSGETLMLAIATDITTLVERERRLVAINDRLERYTAFAAHDLRSPIATIVSGLHLLKRDDESMFSDRSKRFIDATIECADGLASQVETVLSSAKIEEAAELIRKPVDLNLIIEQVRFNLSALLDRAGAVIRSSRLPTLDLEPHLIRQLFQNLIENALKHRSERVPIIIVRYEETERDHLLLVEDNGNGVSEHDRTRIFRAFEQSSETGGGTGLGLALCKRIVSLHNGEIAVDPSVVSGCRIVIRLPKSPTADIIDKAA